MKRGLTSNKPTHYLLDYSDFNPISHDSGQSYGSIMHPRRIATAMKLNTIQFHFNLKLIDVLYSYVSCKKLDVDKRFHHAHLGPNNSSIAIFVYVV